jgi:23S rRNA (cytidine1920-2'-O)/16S rRNA (cytidine1409-2'-O)-methyltransferase
VILFCGMKTRRLDEILIERGDVETREAAFIVVTEGRVFVDGQKAISPAQPVTEIMRVEVRKGREFVGRGALKLDAAIREFKMDVTGFVCADVGAATGGFTEVLLKHGAEKVYAIDTARGKLDPKIREDARVVVMEDENALRIGRLPEPIDLVVIDVSLTSLRVVLPVIRGWLKDDGSVVALLKPQYEAEAKDLHHGIVQTDAIRARIMSEFRVWLTQERWEERGMILSPIRGSEGNTEFLFWLRAV